MKSSIVMAGTIALAGFLGCSPPVDVPADGPADLADGGPAIESSDAATGSELAAPELYVATGFETTTDPVVVPGETIPDGKVEITDTQCTILASHWYADGSLPQDIPECLPHPDAADHNCDCATDAADIDISIQATLGAPLSDALDANGNGMIDACEEPSYCNAPF